MSTLEDRLLDDDLYVNLTLEYARKYPEKLPEGTTMHDIDGLRTFRHGTVFGYALRYADTNTDMLKLLDMINDHIKLSRAVVEIERKRNSQSNHRNDDSQVEDNTD